MTTMPAGPGDGEHREDVLSPTTDAEDVLADAAGIVDDVAEREFDPQDVTAMDALDAPRRILLVHAHPDDESIGNGATMARYASSGASVSLVTCTRGERGEVVVAELAHLEGNHRALAAQRVEELATAMEALGVSDHRFLDDAPLAGEDAAETAAAHYEDSGMAWGEGRVAVAAPDTPPTAFSLADLDEAGSRLAGVLREVRPQVVVTYEPGGGYGHPDHVQAHRVTLRAVQLAADVAAPRVAGSEPWVVAKVYETVIPRSVAAQVFGDELGDDADQMPSVVVDDDQITTVVDAPEQQPAKLAALRAHVTQVRLEGAGFALSSGGVVPVGGTEFYRLAQGQVAADADRDDGRESDLFAGIAPGPGSAPVS